MNVGDTRVRTAEGVFIPASVRADGSTRRAIRVKEGYIPQEEIGAYVIPAKRGLNATGIRPRQMTNEESHQMTPKKDEKEKRQSEEVKTKESRPSQRLWGKRTEPVVNKIKDVSARRSSPISPLQVVPRAYKPSDSRRNRKSSSTSPPIAPSFPLESLSVPRVQIAPSFYKPSDSWRYRKNSSSSSSSSSQSPPRQSRFSDLPSPQFCDPNIDEISNNFSKKMSLKSP